MSAGTISRRALLVVMGGFGASLVIGCRFGPGASLGEGSGAQSGATFEPSPLIRIDGDGTVTLIAHRPEVGTGVRTSMPMLLAEELGVDWKSVKIEEALADPIYADQSIGGSHSVRSSFEWSLKAAAAAAYMLKQAAAEKWGVPQAKCVIEDGVVKHPPTGKSAGFGELVEAASRLPVPTPARIKLKPQDQYTILGKPTKRIDNRDVVTGKATYGIDCRQKGMRSAMLVRPNTFGATLSSFDDSACKQVAGFLKAFEVSDGVAVVAKDTWSAMKAAQALEARWNGGANSSVQSSTITEQFKAAVQPFPARPPGAAKALEAIYELPYISHAPMEPMNCAVSLANGQCEIWVPTQVPQACLDLATSMTGLPRSKVTVHLPLVGGGFGRRLVTDYLKQCIEIAQKLGEPVQLVWTRTDDLQHDFYRPATYHTLQGFVDSSGLPLAFFHQETTAGKEYSNGWKALRWNYPMPEGQMLGAGVESPVPGGAWRSVGATSLGFVNECFFDELCHLGGKDPLEARLALLKEPRLKRTVELAAEKANWGSPLKPGWGRGIACYWGFGSYVTQVAEVECKPGSAKVHKMVAAVDCGFVVNPLGVASMVEGAIMDAIATAFYAEITIANGGVVQNNWDDYRWARMKDAPTIEVHFSPGSDKPSGIGEPGYPPAIAAIGNAVFAATGKRFRRLPITAKDLA